MLPVSKSGYQARIKWVIGRIADAFDSKKTKEVRKRYASEFVDRVKAVLHEHSEDGCTMSDFIPHFKLKEMNLLDFTLKALWKRGLLKKEVRHFLRPEKE